MAWTAPRTWVTGELVTAAFLNTHLRDNLNALKTPPSSNYVLNEGSDYTTTSVTFVDIDATNLALTIVTTGGTVLVGFHGAFDFSGLHIISLDVDVDGVRTAGDDGIMGVSMSFRGDEDGGASFVRFITGLSAGSHTFKLQWKVSSSTGKLYAGAGTASRDYHPQFWVQEFN